MKKTLYILLALDILGVAVLFFATLSSSVIYSFVALALGILQIVPIVAIISNMDNIERLFDEVRRNKYEIKKINDKSLITETTEDNTQKQIYTEKSNGTWECIKCGTVNKEGSEKCQNCNALYSSLVNPTSSPYAKKKLSRWIKNK